MRKPAPAATLSGVDALSTSTMRRSRRSHQASRAGRQHLRTAFPLEHWEAFEKLLVALGRQPHDDPGQAAVHRQVRPRPPGGPARVRCPQDFLRAALERLDLPEETFALSLMVEGRER
jgi:hypothetical protein